MTFIEDRPLTRPELDQLIEQAPKLETRNLLAYLEAIELNAFDFFDQQAVYQFGLIIDDRPLYFAYITNFDGEYELWTVVNSNVKEQFTLYKHSKRSLKQALEQFSPIYATMETHNQKNIEWVKKMGFRPIEENQNTITFKIEREE